MHEKRTSGDSVFVTLSYDDEHLPSDWCLDYYHFQLFMHRLRKAVPVRAVFVCVVSMGTSLGVPIFMRFCLIVISLIRSFISVLMVLITIFPRSLLRFGKWFCLVGDVTLQSAGYVARYNMKEDNRAYGRIVLSV